MIAKLSKAPPAEIARVGMHTLAEHHEHLLFTSFDLSFRDDHGDPDPSSSQVGAIFDFDANFLNPLEDELVDFGGLGDELEKELGWGQPHTENQQLFVPLYIYLDPI